jgi:hypothetical protein
MEKQYFNLLHVGTVENMLFARTCSSLGVFPKYDCLKLAYKGGMSGKSTMLTIINNS